MAAYTWNFISQALYAKKMNVSLWCLQYAIILFFTCVNEKLKFKMTQKSLLKSRRSKSVRLIFDAVTVSVTDLYLTKSAIKDSSGIITWHQDLLIVYLFAILLSKFFSLNPTYLSLSALCLHSYTSQYRTVHGKSKTNYAFLTGLSSQHFFCNFVYSQINNKGVLQLELYVCITKWWN